MKHRRRRRRNPTTTSWVLGAVVGAAVLGLGTTAFIMSQRRKAKKTTPLPCNPDPYKIDIAAVTAEVESVVDAGERDAAMVAQQVATALFGTYPTGGMVSFPPGPAAPAGVDCVWMVLIQVVDDVFRRRGIPVEPPGPAPSSSTSWVLHSASDPGYPWEEPSMQVDNYPTPGTWFDANWNGAFDPDHGYDALVIAVLASALAMAGQDHTIASASGQDPRASLAQSLRKKVRAAIMYVGGVNDRLFGQTNLNLAGGNDPQAPHGDPNKPKSGAYVLNSRGRGLNWLPRHADHAARIEAGLPLLRTTRLNGTKIVGTGGNRQMLLWLPAFDLSALPNDIAFLTWSDGSSTAAPPPQILRLGFDMHGVSLPGVAA